MYYFSYKSSPAEENIAKAMTDANNMLLSHLVISMARGLISMLGYFYFYVKLNISVHIYKQATRPLNQKWATDNSNTEKRGKLRSPQIDQQHHERRMTSAKEATYPSNPHQ